MPDVNDERMYILACKWRDGSITEEEKTEYTNWFNREDGEPLQIPSAFAKDTEGIKSRLWNNIREKTINPPQQKIHFIYQYKWVVAASILVFFIAASTWIFFRHSAKPAVSIATTTDFRAPQKNKAMITLSNGKTVYLDEVNNGAELAQDGDIQIVKGANGQVIYKGRAAQSVTYNTINNPRGSQVVDLILNDGTHVWLNSESSLRYPVAFTGKERVVEITGEAYFEIKHNSSMLFKVIANGETIEDVGTNFNVNAYPEEKAVKTTLLEGAVKIKSTVLKPGEQYENEKIKNVDTDEIMAWKEGLFQFSERTDIHIIMEQIARWYNVQIEYKGEVKQHFWGSISRNAQASQVLKMLEATGGVHFKLEENKIVVMP